MCEDGGSGGSEPPPYNEAFAFLGGRSVGATIGRPRKWDDVGIVPYGKNGLKAFPLEGKVSAKLTDEVENVTSMAPSHTAKPRLPLRGGSAKRWRSLPRTDSFRHGKAVPPSS